VQNLLTQLTTSFYSKLNFEPNLGQKELISKLTYFICTPQHNPIFVLKGYAGTGKTSIVGALVKSLPAIQFNTVLLAPTGRASKVLGNYANKQAYTIHKKIYKTSNDEFTPTKFGLQNNTAINTLFIVDEASMISDAQPGENSYGNSLLEDLLSYVFAGENCKLLLVGDAAQLPPVGLSISHALDLDYLRKRFSITVAEFELTEVMRQNKDSFILNNATFLRDLMMLQIDVDGGVGRLFNKAEVKIEATNDVVKVDGMDLQDVLANSYRKYGSDETIIITRSNKRANAYNQQIRALILDRDMETPVTATDLMMVVKNNYNWLPKEASTNFIANGDVIEIKRVRKIVEMHGFNFATVTVKMLDFPNDPEFECNILLDTILADSPALPSEKNQQLYASVVEDYAHIENAAVRFKQIKADPFLNALQVKFAYAITCHKAQGGQWQSVFVEQAYLSEDTVNKDYLRWLYTAFTRATQKLNLIGFDEMIK